MPSAVSDHPAIDLAAVKARQQATWAKGDFGRLGVRTQIVAERLCETVEVLATDAVLDVAAGSGNASLAAARRFAEVTSTDFVPELLHQGRVRAMAERLPVTFRAADAEALPFDDASFDVALSTFGVMYTPDQERAASELLRVTKPGGRIGLANWTPEGLVGQMFRLLDGFAPLPVGLRSPLDWGTEARIEELFGARAAEICTTRQHCTLSYRSTDHWIEFARAYYGPLNRTLAALDDAGRRTLRAALVEYLLYWNQNDGDALRLSAEYLEVVITKSPNQPGVKP